jgi:perosamine synthetase
MIPAHTPPHNLQELLRAIGLLIREKRDVKKLFENKIKDFLQTENYVTLSSGRRALYLGLKGLGINKGDEIILPAFTTNIVPMVIRETGAMPIPADVNVDDYNICVESVLGRISSKTKAVLAVHTFGYPSQLKALRDICDDRNLFLIEDAAGALGAKLDGKSVGTFGDFSIVSFGVGKSISMCGGGALIYKEGKLSLSGNDISLKGSMSSTRIFVNILGSIILSNPMLYGMAGQLVKNMRVSHQYDHYKKELIDENDISLLSYAIGIQELAGYELERRIETARYYNEYLNDLEGIYPPIEKKNVISVYTRYFVRVGSENTKKLIFDKMKYLGVEPLVPDQGYPISSAYFSNMLDTVPMATMLSKTLIGIPINTRLSENKLQEIFQKGLPR